MAQTGLLLLCSSADPCSPAAAAAYCALETTSSLTLAISQNFTFKHINVWEDVTFDVLEENQLYIIAIRGYIISRESTDTCCSFSADPELHDQICKFFGYYMIGSYW